MTCLCFRLHRCFVVVLAVHLVYEVNTCFTVFFLFFCFFVHFFFFLFLPCCHQTLSDYPSLESGPPNSSSGRHHRRSRRLLTPDYYTERNKSLEGISEDGSDLDQSRGGGRGDEQGQEGYIPDSTESGSTDPDTYDSKNMEVINFLIMI